MEEVSRYIVGIDIGTSKTRCVVASVDDAGTQTIVGFNEVANSGMRKGVVVNLSGPAKAIDSTLDTVEHMIGGEINSATLSINGSHIMSTRTDGMIAVGAVDHELTESDLDRVDEVAATGKIPANREILDLIPYSYRLDGQGNIKDPLGMVGTRLEIKANVVSALTPYCQNIRKVAEMADVKTNQLVASPVAGAKAVLNERQMENGVAVIDFGFSTTGISIYEEGDLQFVSVVPMGSNNVTNDLAMGLKTDPEIAEIIKTSHASALGIQEKSEITIKHDKEEFSFKKNDINEIVEARLDEIFDLVRKDLKKAGYDRKLPEGIVLVGGGANLKDLAEYVKIHLELAVKIGKPSGFAGIGNEVEKPEYAAAVGLMLTDVNYGSQKKSMSSKSANKGLFKKLFSKLKS